MKLRIWENCEYEHNGWHWPTHNVSTSHDTGPGQIRGALPLAEGEGMRSTLLKWEHQKSTRNHSRKQRFCKWTRTCGETCWIAESSGITRDDIWHYETSYNSISISHFFKILKSLSNMWKILKRLSNMWRLYTISARIQNLVWTWNLHRKSWGYESRMLHLYSIWQ